MKKLFFTLITVLFFCNVQAQMSDTDAKLIFQQVEDAYNKKDYTTVVNLTTDLHNKTGAWNTEMLYLYLKSYYTMFTKPGDQTEAGFFFRIFVYKMYNRCNAFFNLVNAKTYPAEKYKEMQEVQIWITNKMEKHGWQALSDADAKLQYQQAEDAYNNKNYYEAALILGDLEVPMGGWNPKALYLDLKSAYLNYTADDDASSKNFLKSYDDFKGFYNDCTIFFTLINKNTYPADKYKEIQDIQIWFKSKMDEYAYENDRKPQDAIDFLNDCAIKFNKNWKGYSATVTFSVENKLLNIHVYGEDDYLKKRKFKRNFRGQMSIDLTKTWMEDNTYYYYHTFDPVHLFYNIYQLGTLDPEAPMIYSLLNDNETGISSYSVEGNYKDGEDAFTTKVAGEKFQNTPEGFYIYQFFDQSSDEFIKGNYRNRIYDAFNFLIKYNGGGIQLKPAKKNQIAPPKNKF